MADSPENPEVVLEAPAAPTAEGASAPTPVEEAPAAPVAEAPATEPAPAAPAYDPEVARYIASLQYRQQALEAELERARNGETERRERERLEAQGFTPEQIDAQLGHLRNYQAGITANAREKAELAQVKRAFEELGKSITAHQLALKHGVQAADLMRCATPEAMEDRAEALAVKAENAKLKQAKVPPQEFAGAAASPGLSGRNVDDMSPEEKVLLGLSRLARK